MKLYCLYINIEIDTIDTNLYHCAHIYLSCVTFDTDYSNMNVYKYIFPQHFECSYVIFISIY